MQKETLRGLIFAAVLVFIFAAVWAFLSLFHSPYADWLAVEAPRDAIVGSPMDIRVTLGNVPGSSHLMVNIYLLGKNHKAVGRLPAPSPPIPVQSGGTYSFRINVTEQEKMTFIQLVIWVSPTGDWRTRTHGASTEAIPVKRTQGRAGETIFRRVLAFANPNTLNPETPFLPGARPPEPEVFRNSPAPFRLALLALLVSGGLACAANAARRLRPARLPGAAGEWRLWAAAAAVLFLAVRWEAFHVGGRLSAWGRKIVEEMDIYYARQSYQRVLLAFFAAAAAGLLFLAVRAVRRKRVRPHITAVGSVLALYLGGSLAETLSFHYVDVLRGVALAGVSLIDAAKTTCAAAILILSLAALRADRSEPGGPG
jgi:hypothetical protein